MRRPRALPASAAICLLLAGCQETLPDYPPAYREYAYVTNGKSNDVSVIDLLNYRPLKTIPVGKGPTGVTANPTRNEVYVVNSDSNSVSVIDAERNLVVATIAVEKRPYFLDLSPDGRRAWVANAGSASVSVIDLDGRRVAATIHVGDQPGLARAAPDGKIVVTANRGEGTVSVIDAATLAVRSTVAVCEHPEELVILLDSSKAFVTCSSSHQVAVVALQGASGSVAPPAIPVRGRSGPHKAEAATATGDRLLSLLDVGKTPVSITLKPDGGEVFVCNFDSDSVSEIYAGTNEVGSTHQTGDQPVRALVSSDNGTLFVSNFGSNNVAVYNIDMGKLVASIHVGERPDALAFTPRNDSLLVVDSQSGDVAVVFLMTRKGVPVFPLFSLIPVGREPRQIAVKSFMLHKPPQ